MTYLTIILTYTFEVRWYSVSSSIILCYNPNITKKNEKILPKLKHENDKNDKMAKMPMFTICEKLDQMYSQKNSTFFVSASLHLVPSLYHEFISGK